MAKTADQIQKKYQEGVARSADAYAQGVANPKRPWAAATAAAAPRWQSGLQAAFANNAFQRGVSRAGDQKWQQNAAQVGAANYSSAAPRAAAAYGARAAEIMGAAAAAQSAVSSMPSANQEQRIQRAVASMKAISNYWKNR